MKVKESQEKKMKVSINVNGRQTLVNILNQIKKEENKGSILEFGVFEGGTLSDLLLFVNENEMENKVYGFDSFEGLPKSEKGWKKGEAASTLENTFNLIKEEIGGNVEKLELVKGIYEDIIKNDIKEKANIDFASLIHIDCDLSDSCRHVLNVCRSIIKEDTFIVFHDWSVLQHVWSEFAKDNKVETKDISSLNLIKGGCDQCVFRIKKIG